MPTFLRKFLKRNLFFPLKTFSKNVVQIYTCIFLILFISESAHAQITITTPYPSAAQQLTRGLDTSLLTVEVNFLSACSNDTAIIYLAPGVTYISGSVTKIAGSSGISISDIAGSSGTPKFLISGVSAAGNIRFTILAHGRLRLSCKRQRFDNGKWKLRDCF